MKKLGLVAALLLALSGPLLLTGCAGCQQTFSHIKSNVVGLQRVITLYANDGSVIKTWTIKGTVEDRGGSFRFLTGEGKAITLSGTVTIEEQ